MARILDIEILKWDEFNPKRDQKSYTWLRLNNDILTDPKLFGLDAEQKLCWIEILCQASKKALGRLKINLDQIAHIAQVEVVKIENLIEFVTAAEIITVHDNSRPRVVVDLEVARQNTTPTNERTNERTNVTNDTNDTLAEVESRPHEFGPRKLAELWNSKVTEGQSVNIPRFKCNSPRWESAKARLRDNPEPEYWSSVIDRITASPFCKGVNDRSWVADFEFLVRVETHIKVLEGKYDKRAHAPPKTREQQAMDHNRDQYERVLKGEL